MFLSITAEERTRLRLNWMPVLLHGNLGSLMLKSAGIHSVLYRTIPTDLQ